MTITLKPTASETTIQNNGSDIFTIDSTGIAMASGKLIASTGPSFSARMTSSQTIPTTAFTKILFNVENWDTNSNYDTTLSRFTPTVAGYYQFNASAFMGTTPNRVFTLLFKNGAVAKYGSNLGTANNGGINTAVNALLAANGSSDYFEVMAYQESGSNQTINSDPTLSWFDGFLARAA